MQFKEMAREMSDDEVKRCMSILIEDSIVLDIRRDELQNFIEVEYRVIGDNRKESFVLSLLPDSIEDIEYRDQLRVDAEFLYQQYLVAKGYSIYWKGNMFAENY